jgi:hypothetical protein
MISVREHNHHMAEMRRAGEAKQRGSKPSKSNSSEVSEPNEPDKSSWRRFERAMGRYGLNDDQVEVMEASFLKESPPDLGSWVEAKMERLGWAKPKPDQSTQPATKSDAKLDAPTTPPVTSVGSAAAQIQTFEQKSPGEWTKDDIARIRSEKGDLAGNRWIAERFEKYLATLKIVPAHRR